ncbi:MAG: hypothetical protein WA815_04345 [Terracidiphilus sp.]
MAFPLANPLTQRQKICERAPLRLGQAPRALHLWHLASLDAPTVAVVWALAFAWAAGVHLDLWILLLLACGTWTVYVGDRLLDARRAIRSGNLDALRERHYFHWRHRSTLIPIACAAAAVAAGLIALRMPVAARSRNSILAAAALMYFSGVHMTARLPRWLRRFASKELLVGLLFTAGCSAPTLTRLHSASWPIFASLILFVALAWANCAAIESWESSMNQTTVFLHTFVLGIAGLAASGAFLFMDARASALAFSAAISALLLSLFDRTRTRISALTLRTLADLVLLAPLVFVILGAR